MIFVTEGSGRNATSKQLFINNASDQHSVKMFWVVQQPAIPKGEAILGTQTLRELLHNSGGHAHLKEPPLCLVAPLCALAGSSHEQQCVLTRSASSSTSRASPGNSATLSESAPPLASGLRRLVPSGPCLSFPSGRCLLLPSGRRLLLPSMALLRPSSAAR